MNLIYIHGLDSDANSTKGMLLEKYCQRHHPDIKVLRPDLNQSPDQVFNHILSLIENVDNKNRNIEGTQFESTNTVLIGSSLGGYFSTLISNHSGCPALLLNPSTQPHITLQRFTNEAKLSSGDKDILSNDYVLHSTAGGWDITNADLQWFANYQLSVVNHPDKVAVLIKEGDELLNPELAKAFYQGQGAMVTVQAGGDHRFSDFEEQLPMVLKLLRQLG
ncbi:YqiA/YcfP family alpha/beta fold hydrolase [Psychrobacter aquaticus]|uniref:Putative esterase n=1 Tax=Psychrobacter aquaticus CMS 56 TaxID=1354303 RepID=U4T646_9GAMM|nr:YqiA/YcfP family alpha/beta fold hydrolase [Psychrobacter aquaticus]ERL56862.1 putative esterase [Psychrobacter aquaticus CMS 56]